MYYAVVWFVVVELLGLLALPLAFRLFHRLPDRGYTLAKPLALLLLGYSSWALGLTRLIPYSQYTLIALGVLMGVLAGLLAWRGRGELRAFLAQEGMVILASEALFAALFALWVFVVAHTPEINHTEKPMDFAFLNSILRSRAFPPEDPWLSGHPISYYYMGHLMMASLTKLTAIPSNIAYNLSLALLPGLVGVAAFGLVYNLVRLSGARAVLGVAFGLTAPLLLLLIGNLEGVLELAHARGWGSEGFWRWVSIKGLEGSHQGQPSWFPREVWWWWRATRVIDTVEGGRSLDYTITEFPYFSFLLGDLHPHVISLPFLLLNLALFLDLLLSPDRVGFCWVRAHPWRTLALGWSLGALGFINIFDLPVFAALLAGVVLVKSYRDSGARLAGSLWPAVHFLAPVYLVAVALYTPFYATLHSQASGILPLRDVGTRPIHFLLIWGLPLLLTAPFLVGQVWGLVRRPGGDTALLLLVLGLLLLPFVLWAGLELLLSFFEGELVGGLLSVGSRFGRVLPLMALAGLGLYGAFRWAREPQGSPVAFAALFLSLGYYLLVGAELFYLQDLFGTRMNTVFKLYYQAWLFLAMGGAYSLYYWGSRAASPARLPRLATYGWFGLAALLLAASLYYPVGAAWDKTRGFSGRATLDGLAFVKEADPAEYEAIAWLRDEAEWGRMVEAVGDDYSEYGRISASTGLPAVLGWRGHEHQWRGSTVPFHGRPEDVAELYRIRDAERLEQLLRKYNVRYVYAGRRERSSYGELALEQFPQLLRPVFRSGSVIVFEVVPEGAGP